jgi:hypothetical protein
MGKGQGPRGSRLRPDHKDGPQRIRISGAWWSDEAERIFLDHLAASCNVSASAAAAGFSAVTVYNHRRSDPGFAARWQEALDQGYARVEMELVRTATDYLAGLDLSDLPLKGMTVRDAVTILGMHRVRGSGDGRGPRFSSTPRGLDEVRESIILKLERIASALPPDEFKRIAQVA